MAAFTPSKYQKAVYTYMNFGKGNAVIDAVAGSGKSTTIVNALKMIPNNKQVLFLAFNKAIVEELKVKIGDMKNVDVKTIHGLGASTIFKNLKSTLQDDKYKSYVNDCVRLGMFAPTVSLYEEQMINYKNNILKLVDLGRVNLTLDPMKLDELANKHDIYILDNECEMAIKAIQWGSNQLGVIDYTDMIFFPNVKKIQMPTYDWVFIDECQDLNAAQRELFLKCVKPNGRFIAVGDPRQAIYGFAGADIESFNILKSLPNTVKLPLSVCYRCDSDIINLAKSIVPQIEARSGAPAGIVKYDSKLVDIKDGDMVLCRITAPLVNLCMKYIAEGIKAYVKGRDIGTNLINLIKKTNRKQIKDVLDRLETELSSISEKIAKKQKCTLQEAEEDSLYTSFKDKIKAIEIISGGLLKSEDVIKRIESIFKDDEKSGICLSTIHKSKGLEADNVFIICEDKLYLKSCMKIPWMAEQERNLVYVAYTRAKHYLGFVSDFQYN